MILFNTLEDYLRIAYYDEHMNVRVFMFEEHPTFPGWIPSWMDYQFKTLTGVRSYIKTMGLDIYHDDGDE